jgi:hypothetical protein
MSGARAQTESGAREKMNRSYQIDQSGGGVMERISPDVTGRLEVIEAIWLESGASGVYWNWPPDGRRGDMIAAM